MNISSVKPGDIVEVDMRGWKFLAYVDEIIKKEGKQGMLNISPCGKNISWNTCKATQVIAHYKKMQRTRTGAKRETSNGETLQAL